MNAEITRKHVPSPQLANDVSLDTMLGEVAGEFFDRMTNGERPQIEDYVARYPEIAEQIRAAFPALQIVGDSRAENDDKRTDIDLAKLRRGKESITGESISRIVGFSSLAAMLRSLRCDDRKRIAGGGRDGNVSRRGHG